MPMIQQPRDACGRCNTRGLLVQHDGTLMCTACLPGAELKPSVFGKDTLQSTLRYMDHCMQGAQGMNLLVKTASLLMTGTQKTMV